MLNATMILQSMDKLFTSFIFIPMVYILYYKFSHRKKGARLQNLYKISLVLVMIFIFRLFLDQFVCTEVNYDRIMSGPFAPLLKAIFYPNH